jgi:type IV pilus assembly protein PilN
MIRVNLLGLPKPKRKRGAAVSFEGGRTLGILGVVLLLVAGVEYFHYGRLQKQDKDLSVQIQKLQAEKSRLEVIRSDYERFSRQKELLQKRIGIIEGLKAKQAGPINLLNMLASTVTHTDMLWLTNFDQAGQKITIEGVALSAKAVADFLTQLKESKAFSEMELKETVQEPAAKDIPRFNFTVNGQLANAAPNS